MFFSIGSYRQNRLLLYGNGIVSVSNDIAAESSILKKNGVKHLDAQPNYITHKLWVKNDKPKALL